MLGIACRDDMDVGKDLSVFTIVSLFYMYIFFLNKYYLKKFWGWGVEGGGSYSKLQGSESSSSGSVTSINQTPLCVSSRLPLRSKCSIDATAAHVPGSSQKVVFVSARTGLTRFPNSSVGLQHSQRTNGLSGVDFSVLLLAALPDSREPASVLSVAPFPYQTKDCLSLTRGKSRTEPKFRVQSPVTSNRLNIHGSVDVSIDRVSTSLLSKES